MLLPQLILGLPRSLDIETIPVSGADDDHFCVFVDRTIESSKGLSQFELDHAEREATTRRISKQVNKWAILQWSYGLLPSDTPISRYMRTLILGSRASKHIIYAGEMRGFAKYCILCRSLTSISPITFRLTWFNIRRQGPGH